MKLRIEFDNSTEGGCEPEAVVDVVEVSSYRGDGVLDVDVWCDVIEKATTVSPEGTAGILAELLMRSFAQGGLKEVARCLESKSCISIGQILEMLGKEAEAAREAILAQFPKAE